MYVFLTNISKNNIPTISSIMSNPARLINSIGDMSTNKTQSIPKTTHPNNSSF